jgi:cytochrome c2
MAISKELNRCETLAAAEIPSGKMTTDLTEGQKYSILYQMAAPGTIALYLENLFAGQIYSLDEFIYSNTLQADNRAWTEERLKNLLQNPDSEFKGTSIPSVHLTDSELDSLVKYLKVQLPNFIFSGSAGSWQAEISC